MKKLAPWILIALSIVGIALAWHLTDIHFQVTHTPSEELDSLCEINETVSCAKVNASKWSAIRLFGADAAELPVSLPAVGFYAGILLLTLLGIFGSEERQRQNMSLVAVATAPALLFSLWLVYVQAVLLKAWCLFCLGLDVTTMATLIVAVVGTGGGWKDAWTDFKSSDKTMMVVGLLALLGVTWISYSVYAGRVARADKPTMADSEGKKASPSEAEDLSPEEKAKAIAEAKVMINEFLEAYPKTPVQEVAVRPFDAFKGNPDAAITVVEFADFECPHCRLAGFFLKDIAHRYGDQVQFVFKNYPLGMKCNPGLTRDVHPDSCEAGQAVQCAKRQGKFWEFHDSTFDNQGALGRKKMMTIAGELGLDAARFEECLDKDTIATEISQQVADGKALGINGTPSIFVNGRALSSIHPLAIEAALRKELRDRNAPLPGDPDGLFPY